MKKRTLLILINALMLLILLSSGCLQKDTEFLPLIFSDFTDYAMISTEKNDLIITLKEEKITDYLNALIYTMIDSESVFCGMKTNGTVYRIGKLSTIQTPEELLSMERVKIFGNDAIKFHGILGTNYAIGYYYVYNGDFSDSFFLIEGNLTETDLTGNGKNEIIATMGTIPETSIYIMNEQSIQVSNINKSVNAVSARFLDSDSKTFELFFEPDKPKLYIYKDKKLKVR
ncbi:MAG: hypothetical protein Q8S24_08440 [Eubacteriales bacterium]|nr:hypothetical protein [Eubacteriales bacterium]